MTEDSTQRGTLIPIGGAEERIRDRAVLRRFIEVCGDSPRIVIVPTASQLETTGEQYEATFRDLGAAEAFTTNITTRAEGDDPAVLSQLESCDGVFLTGGNQLRLSTTIGGTEFARTLKRRFLEERLHVAGTSAGAAFLSEHMIAFGDEGPTPRSNMVTLAPGLGLADRIIIDQHFRQRDRLGRLLTALSYNPSGIGIGLDEDTAAIIEANRLRVCGTGGITIVDPGEIEFSSMDSSQRDEPVSVIGVRLHVLIEGGVFDLQTRTAALNESPAPVKE